MRRWLFVVQTFLAVCCIRSLDAREIALKTAYFTEYGLLPGVSVGVERAFLDNPIHSLHLGADASLIVNRRNYAVIDVEPYIGYRLTLPFGLLFELQAGAGIIHYLPLVYQLRRTDEGNWEPLPAAGMITAASHVALGFGWDFAMRTRIPLALYAGARVILQYQHINGFLLFRPALAIGVRY